WCHGTHRGVNSGGVAEGSACRSRAACFAGDACFLCSRLLETQAMALPAITATLEETARRETDRGADDEQRWPQGPDALGWRVDGRERDAVVEAPCEIPLGRGELLELPADALQVGGGGGIGSLPERGDVGAEIADVVGEGAR